MVTLYYAYSYNVTSAVEDGILIFKNSNNQVNKFQAYEKLTLSDIESLSKFSYEKNNFEIAIEILQSLLQLIPNSKSKINENFLKNLEKLKKNLVQLNNGYLQKRRKFIGKISYNLFANQILSFNSKIGHHIIMLTFI